jgi:hypothetical protein
MMRIDGPISLLQALRSTLPARQPETPQFGAQLPATPGVTPPASTAVPVQSVAILVALASAADVDGEQRIQDLRHAEQGIEALALLHSGLLAGVLSPQRIRALKDWVKSRRTPDDPELAPLTDDVELRILVELAKLER